MADRDAQAPDLNGILSKLQELEARCQRYEGEIQQKDAKLQAFTVNKSKVHLSLFCGVHRMRDHVYTKKKTSL
jgi:hypothetical protein